MDHIPGIGADIIKENQEMQKDRQRQDVEVLGETLEDFSFFSWGLSEKLKVTQDGKTKYVQLRIKSVGIADILEVYQKKQPTPPAVLRTYKKDSEVARELGKRHDIVVWESNEADPTYLEEKRKHDNDASQEILLRGLGHNLVSDGKVVLRGGKLQEPTEIIDREGAMKALQRMGLTSEHFGSIVRSIRELTAEKDTEEDRE